MQEIQEYTLLDHEEWDTELEVPNAVFMAEEDHAEINADTTKGSGHEKNETLREALYLSPLSSTALVDYHQCEGSQVATYY